jgi:Carboxypeptidase regulatory-like domain/TonB dependent receptor
MACLKSRSDFRNCRIRGHLVPRMWLAVALVFWIVPLSAQTPEASVRGVVSNSGGQPVVGAEVIATRAETGFGQTTTTDSQGEYYFGSLPRGLYSFKVEMASYRGLEKRGVELAVGAKQEENFTLAPLSTSQDATGGVFVIVPPAPALPVETIASSVSVVVDESKILELPLASRNIYSLFLLQPGVTSQGAIGTRGLTFSVHGQRVSGSNYQLDGVDNNNIVLTGPVATTSAEAIQEFRMVNSSFSAQNGRATAFVAQVVTRSGSNRFHGSVFEFLGNDALDANTFENNSNGIANAPLRQNQFGYSLGGPIQKNQTFFWSGLEFSRLHYGTPMTLQLPSALFIASLPQGSEARRLLTEIPPLPASPVPGGDPNIGQIQIQAPGRIDSLLATERLDHDFTNAKDRLMGRFTVASTASEPGEEFTGYPSLMPTDHFRAYNTMLSWTHSFAASRVNDFRIGWSREQIELPRPQSDVALLQSSDGVNLPGGSVVRQSGQRENNNVIQISDTFSARRGRSALTMGFEYRGNLSNSLSLGLQNTALGGDARVPDGFYIFNSIEDFGAGQPVVFGIAVDRFSSGQLRLPDLQREYRSNEFAAFVQDDTKLSRRFSLNLGLRYEYYGVLHNVDRSKDLNFYFGQGSTIEDQLASGVLRSTPQNPGDLKGLLYRPDRLNFAPSIGIAWDPFGQGRTVLRAGYALAFDRVFDTLRDLRTNSQQVVNCSPPFTPGCSLSFLVPAQLMLPLLNQDLASELPAPVVQLDENLRTPNAQNWYLGVQQTVTPSLLVEIGYAASVGKKLISRDVINRSIGILPALNTQIGEDTFLSNAGYSNYQALQVGLRRRFSRGLQYQVTYTWSHAIDNQSDIFQGPRTGPGAFDFALATFTRQFDAQVDRGNADFDERHNLVLNAIWDVPAPQLGARWANWFLKGWTTSMIGAHRSGFPITVIGDTGIDINGLANNRLDLVPGQTARLSHPVPVPGGVQWLNPNAFQLAVSGVGNTGRGAIPGPGFWNYDFAVLRNIALTEGGIRMQFRTEFYNVFNHANLYTPVSSLAAPNFGQAFYGLNQSFSRFGDLSLGSPSRKIQFGLRFEF